MQNLAQEFGLDLTEPAVCLALVALIAEGVQFDRNDVSPWLMLLKRLNRYQPHFTFDHFRVHDVRRAEERGEEGCNWVLLGTEATVAIVGPGDEKVLETAGGNGPVNALDRALRRALVKWYPAIDDLKLDHFRVKSIGTGSEAVVWIEVEWSNGSSRWRTSATTTNVIDGSWFALVDAVEYLLYIHDNKK